MSSFLRKIYHAEVSDRLLSWGFTDQLGLWTSAHRLSDLLWSSQKICYHPYPRKISDADAIWYWWTRKIYRWDLRCVGMGFLADRNVGLMRIRCNGKRGKRNLRCDIFTRLQWRSIDISVDGTVIVENWVSLDGWCFGSAPVSDMPWSSSVMCLGAELIPVKDPLIRSYDICI